MEDQKTKSRKKTALRQQAEKKLKDQGTEFEELTPENNLRLMHELRVHQVELEIQNDELRQTQVSLEEARSRYRDLYDFAPVSYFTLDEFGRILGANLTAVKLLGVERGLLSGKLFLQFVAREDMGVFNRFLPQVLESPNRESCEIRLQGESGEVEAHLDGVLWQDTGGERRCGVTVTDISNLQAAERELRRHRDHLEQLVLERTVSLDETVQKLRHEMAERRQAEAEIKRLASFPQLNPSPTLEIDATGAITYYNQAAVAAVEKLGAGARLTDFLPDDLEEIQTAARQGGEKSYYREVSFANGVFAEHVHFAEPFDVLRVYAVDITPRKRFEEDLRQSEARYRNLFQDSHAVMLVIDPETGVIVDANPAACSYYGYTKAELTARRITDINTLPADQVFDKMHRALAGERKQFSFRHRLANGEVRDVEVFSASVQFPEKTFLFSILHDVTARKQAEAALRDREAKYRAVIETSSDGFCIADMAGCFLEFNNAFAGLLGYSREELLTMSISDIEAQKTPAEIAAAIEKVRRQGHTIFETRLRSKDGRVWPAEPNITYWPINGGRMFFFVRDITERRQAEDALQQAHDELEQRVLERTTELRLTVEQLQFEVEERLAAEEMLKQSEARFRSAFDQSPVGAVIVDQDLRFQRVNPTFCQIIGYTAEELASMSVADISYPEDLAKNQEASRGFLAGELDHIRIEERNIRKDGAVIWIDLAVSVINPGDRPSYFLGIVQDITARKEAERLIQRQSDILAGINRIFRRALACETEVELDRTCLAVMLGLSGAEFGVIYELNPSGRLDAITINDEALAACRMGIADLPKNMKIQGLYRGVIQEKQSLLTNDPASHPDSIGVPQGHIPLTSFLGVPLVQGEAVMGLVGLGNKAGGFEPADQEMAETLSVAIAEALTRLRTERRETSISRLYRVLSKVNEAIVRARDRETLFGEICRVMVEEGRFKMAWIGLVDQEEGLVKAVAQHGLDQGYLERIRIPLRKSPESLGPTGIAVREGKYDVCNDIANDPRMSHWREPALSRGYRASGSFPLQVGSKVIGCLTMYAEAPSFFTDEEIGLLGNLALDVSFAIESLEREGQRRQAEEALKESEERLRYLASQMIHAQETERKRISMELHDDLGQILTVLKLQVREIDSGLPVDFQELRSHCADLRNNIDEVIEKMRRLSRDLSPSILVDLGLPAALRYLTEEFSKYHDIKLSLKMGHIRNRFTAAEEINLYRIFQEVLNNIVKHAQATRIEITIKKHNEQVTFRVHDNGKGFNRDHILSKDTSSRGLGLTAIGERIRMLGGTLEISSQEGEGTSIAFVVPVRS
jgi:PAS domain S-box-containing protein